MNRGPGVAAAVEAEHRATVGITGTVDDAAVLAFRTTRPLIDQAAGLVGAAADFERAEHGVVAVEEFGDAGTAEQLLGASAFP